jgi:RNA polymerase sigma factor (sigma-70 family)
MYSEQDLIRGCAKGERALQKALYEQYCRKMMAICMRYASAQPDAEDILQEGFVKVFSNIRGFRGESKLETWMTRIMINTALNHQRQKLYLLPMVNGEDVEIPEAEEVSLAGFHWSELISIVQSLPDGCRIVFNLFAIEGYAHKEIADMVGISEGTSKSQYNRARNLLQKKIKESGESFRRYGE